MESFNHRGKEVVFWSITGEVIGNNKYSETHSSVSVSAGRNSYRRNGGFDVHSSSETITNHEFWIKTEDGLEKDITLRDANIPLRQGQKITIISAGINGAGSGWYSILVNHSAGKHWFICSAEKLNWHLKLELITGKSLLIAIPMFFGTSYFSESWGLALGVTGVFIVYRLAVKLRRMSNLKNRLKQHLESLAQLAYKNH